MASERISRYNKIKTQEEKTNDVITQVLNEHDLSWNEGIRMAKEQRNGQSLCISESYVIVYIITLCISFVVSIVSLYCQHTVLHCITLMSVCKLRFF